MSRAPRIVFMGTPGFAAGVLQSLIERHYSIVGVVSVPDKPSGRGLQLHRAPVAEVALMQGIPLIQPPMLKDRAFIAQLEKWNADIFVVVAFRMLPQEVWKIPRLGTFNLHASLLPQYRGAAPINWAIIRGETTTGVTTFLIDHQIDTGSILFQESVSITAKETAGSLHDRLMVTGADLVCRTIDALTAGAVQPQPQSNSTPLYGAPKLNKEICRIQWGWEAPQICNLIRGLSPSPAAYGLLQNSMLEPVVIKIFQAEPVEERHTYPFGTLQSDGKNYLNIACKGGYVSLLELQAAGKKRMFVRDFLLGFRNHSSFIFV